jgi:hypothetical protein
VITDPVDPPATQPEQVGQLHALLQRDDDSAGQQHVAGRPQDVAGSGGSFTCATPSTG